MEMTTAGATGPEFLTLHAHKWAMRTGTALERPGLVSTESQSFQNQRPLPSTPCFQSPQPIPSDSPMYTSAHRHPQQRCHPGTLAPLGGGRQGADRQADDGFTVVQRTAATTAACGSDAKMGLAYTTGPFSVPNCPARPSRTTEGLILYGAVGCAATVPHRAHC